MIGKTLQHIVNELNAYIKIRTEASPESPVAVGSLFDDEGKAIDRTSHSVIATVVNISEERITRSVQQFSRTPEGAHQSVQPNIRLNIKVLFTATLKNYANGLLMLSHVMAFFQGHKFFYCSDMEDHPLPQARYHMDMQSLAFEQQNHMWGSLGAKYMPSALYNLTVVELVDEEVDSLAPSVTEIIINEEPGGAG